MLPILSVCICVCGLMCVCVCLCVLTVMCTYATYCTGESYMELEHNHMTTVATEVGNHTQQVTGSLLWMYNSHNVTSTYFYFMTKFFAVFCLSFPVFLCLYLCITVVIHMD